MSPTPRPKWITNPANLSQFCFISPANWRSVATGHYARVLGLASFCRKTHRLLICNDLTVLPGRRTYLMPMLFHSYGCVESNGRHPQLTPAILALRDPPPSTSPSPHSPSLRPRKDRLVRVSQFRF